MRTLLISGKQILSQAFHRTVSISWTSHTLPFNYNLCTQTDTNSNSPELDNEAQSSLYKRIEKLPKEEPVCSAFQSWMGDGFPVHRGDIFYTINRLRKRKQNKRALQVVFFIQ